ncbi:MAG: type IX secretion system membrane protein PorP/SprF [Cyclobacteriaceae bacterium]
MKRFLIFACLLITFTSYAQQDPFFSHFALNPLQYNAGWIGAEKTGYLTLQHRSQWLGYPQGDAPTTQHLSFAVPFIGKISGFALNIVNDAQGPFGRFEAKIGAGYNVDTRTGTFSIGLMPGIISQSINSDLIPVEPGDPAIPLNGQSELKANLDAGIVYTAKKGYYIGVGFNNLLAPDFSFGATGENVIERSFAVSAGIEYELNRDVDIIPTVLVRTDGKTYTMDIGAIAYLRDKLWGGITYRLEESANLLIGYNLLKDNALKVGYSFEYVIQNQDAKQATSHELFVRYNLPNILIGGKKPVYTPRFIH